MAILDIQKWPKLRNRCANRRHVPSYMHCCRALNVGVS